MSKRDSRSDEAKAYRRLYQSAAWKRLRLMQLAQSPLCQFCIEQEIVTEATEVHHADGGHKGDVNKFWSGPFLSTCRSCHSRRGQREDLGQDVISFDGSGWPI